MPGGGRRQKPIRDVSCPRCGTRAVFAERQPYCPNCHWNLERTRLALQPAFGSFLLFLGWGAFIAFVFADSWLFFVFPAGMVGYYLINNFLALRSLPRSTADIRTPYRPVPLAQSLSFSAVRKTADYRRVLVLLLPGFAIAGVVSLVYALQTLRIGPFEWRRLSDLVGPAIFTFIGCTGTWAVVKHRLTTEKILKHPVCVSGIVTEASENGLRYRFRDLSGLEHEGEGTEYSGYYYEEMALPVVYEHDNPKNNLPVSALYDEYEVSVKLF